MGVRRRNLSELHKTDNQENTFMSTTNELLSELQNQMNQIENQMAEMWGMKLYKSAEGFTNEKLYEYAGVKDCVVTLKLKPGSPSALVYGEDLTVVFVYQLKERNKLSVDKAALNSVSTIKAKELLHNIDEELQQKLKTDGLEVKDIVEILVTPATDEANTFGSSLLRKPKVLEIPFEAKGKGQDIGWMYGALCRFKSRGIALTPEEYAQYLAYKLVLENEELTEEERKEIFDETGSIYNQAVAYYWLKWREDAGRLSEKDRENLHTLSQNRFYERLAVAERELKNMGLSFKKLSESHPEKAALLIQRILTLHEHRYNVTGGHLMYLSYESFLHIYLRHVKELAVENQFEERSKFQLAEADLKYTMDAVLHAINDEYQAYKEEHPNNRFFRKGAMAYYYNGDYYAIDIQPDGQIGSFYKIIDKK